MSTVLLTRSARVSVLVLLSACNLQSAPPPEPGECQIPSWTRLEGPCSGTKTNAMWFDSTQVGYIGCGENQFGNGLFVTRDGGRSWEDAYRFKQVRVMDIRRGPDGVLYGAGRHGIDRYSVWSIDESGDELEPTGLYHPSKHAYTSVPQAENVAITQDGQILIDSLTGTTAAYKPGGQSTFSETGTLSEDAISDPKAQGFQVRQIVAFNNDFYAVGSLISDAATVRLPSRKPGATYHFHSLALQPAPRLGELLDMYVWSDSRMIVVGHDQSMKVPLIYQLSGDPTDLSNWHHTELFRYGMKFDGGANAVAAQGNTIVIVGGRVPASQGGFAARSVDGGKTWVDVTPYKGCDEENPLGALSRVWLFEDGSMMLAGGGGELWNFAG